MDTGSKAKKSLAIHFIFILTLILLSGCVSNPISPSSSNNSAQLTSNENLEGILLPFDESGKLIWNTFDLNATCVEYLKERSEDYTFISYLSKDEYAQDFINLINSLQKDLVGAVKESMISSETLFTEFDRGTEIYRITINTTDQFNLAIASKAADCGYLFFRLNINSDKEDYYYSLYKINLNNFQQLEELLESFEKNKDFLTAKPVLYLYPENELDVSVTLAYKGQLALTYPVYNNGWNVRAYPDGRLINKLDGLEYSYLFWEGFPDNPKWWNLSEGYCIPGSETASFLRKTLGEFGLTPKEYNEFIVYWLPQMQNNPYNLITFQWEDYEKLAPLTINPAPDSVLRVFMVFAPLEKPIDIDAPIKRENFIRNGFTVVEWGASRIEYNK